MQLSTYAGEDYNEMEARFAVLDSIIKAICELTGCRVKLEQSVKASDALDAECLPDVSKKSVSDYVLYEITYSGKRKVVLIEGKSETLSKSTVSQLIGYYIASQVVDDFTPPLGLVLTQSKARFVFFPYKSRTQVYIDAIVTDIINLHQNDLFAAVISFVTRYILCAAVVKTITWSEKTLHKKEAFKKYVISYQEFVQNKEQELRAKLHAEKAALAKLQAEKDAALAKLQAEKDAALAKLQAEKDAALAEKDAALAEKDAALAKLQDKETIIAQLSRPSKRPRL